MRRTLRSRALAAACVAVTLYAGAARAQAADATTAAARARFQEGVELFDHGDYEAARVAFLQALALKRHPVVLLNVAQCALRTNRPLEAKRHFEAFVAEAANATAAQREEARKGIADASLKVPRIVVDSEAVRRIVVDGVASAVTGRGFVVEVEVGTHRYTLEGVTGAVLRDGERAFAAGESFEARVSDATSASVAAVPVVPTAAPIPTPLVASAEPEGPTGPGIFARPENMVPVYAGLGVGAVGTVGAVVFLLAKNQASDNARTAENFIRAEGGGRGACNAPNPTATIANLCANLRENYDAVDKDALFGNISLGAAIAGTAFGAGWYLFAPKKAPAASTGLVLAPHVDLLGSQKIVGLLGHF
jgi:hypothetical protein